MMLAGTAAITASGAMLQMKNIIDLGMIAALGSLLLVLGLHFYRDNGKNYYNRVALLYAFGFCSGQTMGPLLKYVVSVNSSIIVTALVGTMITFASLSIAALLAQRGQFLFLGGVLMSVINTMALFSILNIFFKSMFVHMVSNLIKIIFRSISFKYLCIHMYVFIYLIIYFFFRLNFILEFLSWPRLFSLIHKIL